MKLIVTAGNLEREPEIAGVFMLMLYIPQGCGTVLRYRAM